MGKGRVPFDSISVSDNGKWLLHSLGTGSSSRNELRIFDLEKGTGPAVVAAGVDAQFSGQVVGDKLYVATNWKAPNRRLLMVDVRNPAIENAKEVIAEREWVMSGARVVGGRLFASYLENVQTKLRAYSLDGKPEGEVAAPGVGVMSLPAGRLDNSEAFLTYTSFDEPGSIWRYDVKTGARELWWRSSVAVKPGEIEVKQVWYTSKDGTKVPMWLVHRKGLVPDGNRPVFLTGYGGFNLSRLPSFTPAAVVWSQLDGVYALPNLRGGGEFGEKWHKAGMLENKQNVFDDFIGAAEWLIANKYTKPSRLAIAGGSNGGLLVGAAVTQRPELFGAVVCSVPLLDMVRYHDLLLGRFWVTEYGSSEKPEQFKYLVKYSPYHRVEKGTKYPSVLFVTGDLDTRVDPMHARKMTALMQSATGSDKPVMLKYDTKSGHSGGKPVAQQIEEMADEHLFALRALGVEVK
jgi:prolyl oligopeptidase